MVLFAGHDASGNPGLWVTDGTCELAVAGSFANGVFFDINAPDLTGFAGKALFVGADTNRNIGLRITDARGAGTSELTSAEVMPTGCFSTPQSRGGFANTRSHRRRNALCNLCPSPMRGVDLQQKGPRAPLSRKLMIKKINFS